MISLRLLLFPLAAACISVFPNAGISAEPAEAPPRAIPTFECVGLYWKPAGGAAENKCSVQYRAENETQWHDAMPLWFDPNPHPAPAEEHGMEYRGSIVHLQPATAYVAQLKLEKTGTEATVRFTTRDDRFPVAKTVYLSAEDAKKQPFKITEGGTETGYVLYTVKPGENVIFDGHNEADSNLTVDASYVILKGLALKNAKANGIVVGGVHDVVIDHCDISGWGRIAPDGWGVNFDSAVFSKNPDLARLTVQYCALHDPRSNSNCWTEWRVNDKGQSSAHPMGPQGISCFQSKDAQFVVRYNHIYGDLQHKFNDSMGEFHNFSFDGFPGRDSDIYGNVISNVCDDGIEMEGADMNVRVWNNRFDSVYGAVGCATSSLGPIYIWRNVLHSSRKGVLKDADSNKGAYLVKLGNENPTFTKGKIFVFHNTMLQPPPRDGFTETSGGNSGLILTSDKKTQSNITSRNNILFVRNAKAPSVRDPSKDSTNDFDYDLYNGVITARDGSEPHGINAAPQFAVPAGDTYPLLRGTPGIDVGERLPNFNDDFKGKGPDIGAFETP